MFSDRQETGLDGYWSELLQMFWCFVSFTRKEFFSVKGLIFSNCFIKNICLYFYYAAALYLQENPFLLSCHFLRSAPEYSLPPPCSPFLLLKCSSECTAFLFIKLHAQENGTREWQLLNIGVPRRRDCFFLFPALCSKIKQVEVSALSEMRTVCWHPAARTQMHSSRR